MYKEGNDSTFTHDQKCYSVDKCLAIAQLQDTYFIKVDDLKWIINHCDPPDIGQVNKADLRYPVLVTEWTDGDKTLLVVVDGFHRLNKAINLGVDQLPAKLINLTEKEFA